MIELEHQIKLFTNQKTNLYLKHFIIIDTLKLWQIDRFNEPDVRADVRADVRQSVQ